MRKLNVLHACNLLGLGGASKSIQVYVKYHNRDIFDVSVCGVLTGGPRQKLIEAMGIKVALVNGDRDRLLSLLRQERVDIVHFHRAGHEEPLVPTAAKEAGVPVLIEHSVFGAVDDSPSGQLYDHGVFISQMIAWRYCKKKHWSSQRWSARNKVLYYPVDFQEIVRLQRDDQALRRTREAWGIPLDAPLVGRIGRAHDRKWGTMFVEMMPHLVERVPGVYFLIVGATDVIQQKISDLGLTARCRFVDETPDESLLGAFYQMMDCFAHSSQMGESFGLVIAEAMAFGKPVVTHSIPKGDNAQIELVDHGLTGFVANHPRTYAEAAAFLLRNKPEAERLGRNGREKVQRLFDARIVTRQLERLYLELLALKKVSVAPLAREAAASIPYAPSLEELEAFEAEYRRRLRQAYGELRPAEWIRVRAKAMQSPYQPLRTLLKNPLALARSRL